MAKNIELKAKCTNLEYAGSVSIPAETPVFTIRDNSSVTLR